MSDLTDRVRTAVQAILDAEGDGYHLAQLVVCMGLERIEHGGAVKATSWLWAPPGQPDWMTSGLLEATWAQHQDADDDD